MNTDQELMLEEIKGETEDVGKTLRDIKQLLGAIFIALIVVIWKL